MQSQSTILIEENFPTTKNLESLFATMNKVSALQTQMLDILKSYKDDITKILNLNLDSFLSLHSEIKTITVAYTGELQTIFKYENISDNIEFVKKKLEGKKRDLINKIDSVPLDQISNVENFLSGYDNSMEITQGERRLKVSPETALFDLIREHRDGA